MVWLGEGVPVGGLPAGECGLMLASPAAALSAFFAAASVAQRRHTGVRRLSRGAAPHRVECVGPGGGGMQWLQERMSALSVRR